MVVEIPLTRGLVALVDDEDAEAIGAFSWYARRGRNTFYAARTVQKNGRVHMHREIVGCPEDAFVDHVDHDGLNNVRGNLRVATNSENQMNSSVRRPNATGSTGVVLDKSCGRWRAQIHYRGRRENLGSFGSPEEAAQAYEERAISLFGAFAQTSAHD